MNIEICIALVPEQAVSLALQNASVTLAESNTNGASSSILQLQGNDDRLSLAPHMTLYQTSMPIASLDSAADKVREWIKTRVGNPLHMDACEISSNEFEGSTEIKYRPTDEIHHVQDAVVKIFNIARAGMTVEKNPAGLTLAEARFKTSGAHLTSLEEYGFPEVGPTVFNPHVTVSWHKGGVPDAGSLSALKDLCAFSGLFNTLAIYSMGPQGSCPQRIWSCEMR